MEHFDEHTIDLFALRSARVESRRRAFEEHLAQCDGCREQYEELVRFYQATNSDQRLLGEHEANADSASLSIRPEYRVIRPAVPRYRTVPAWMWQEMKRRPLATVFSGIVAVVLGFILFRPGLTLVNTNPARTRLNEQTQHVEVLNVAGQKLWDLPLELSAVGYKKLESDNRATVSLVADLDNDGRKEIITLAQSLEEGASGKVCLRTFTSSGRQVLERSLGTAASFRGKEYAPLFVTRGLVLGQRNPDGTQDIFAMIAGRHSPCVVYRLKTDGTILGEYWHFGHFNQMYLTSLDSNGKDMLVLSGFDDVRRQGLITALDAVRINGQCESPATEGFGLQRSDAEVYSVLIPFTEIEKRDERGGVRHVFSEDSQTLRFWYVFQPTNNAAGVCLDYEFSKDFRIRDIKISDSVYPLMNKTSHSSNPPSVQGDSYTRRLKQGLRWWDGLKWGHTAVRIGR